MSSQAKTIQIFLPPGNPHGIRSAEITTRNEESKTLHAIYRQSPSFHLNQKKRSDTQQISHHTMQVLV
ncbi:hypothetical protein [Psychrobacter lutiphocae]|uniref:hypothetical protein n=1 Tax=Psychrobacter lutiphocae TaxID=540500 RepID=UPI000378F08C|nr:hypothetical protein [Psychrobacter lutiphocae]